LAVVGLLVIGSGTAEAYIGPGAGFALLGSFLVLFLTFVLAIVALVTWPLRFLWRLLRGRKAYARAKARRVVILGLDGMCPDLVDRYMAEGKLPNLAQLREEGSYRRLQTTFPSMSPVAWSSFQTGVNPGRHNIFDFLTRDRRTYLPDLSSAQIRPPRRRLSLGGLSLPLGKPVLRLLRRSKPFWATLGEHGIFSSVIRVPITFPPEKFNGLLLSAMCVPDLKGTQGTFTLVTSKGGGGGRYTGGQRVEVTSQNGQFLGALPGPQNPLSREGGELRLPFRARPRPGREEVLLEIEGRKIALKKGSYSDWVPLTFKAGLGVGVPGICRFYLKQAAPDFEMYVTPINIDPERPALPVSHPLAYSVCLSKLLGRYATLGLAEDTWALNEGVIDEAAFLEQCYRHHEEREKMLFHALGRQRRGLVACVFDTTDRVQHMFWRNHDRADGPHAGAVEQAYRKMDDLVGRVRARLRRGDVLIVMSDHGFKAFRWGVNVNSWLRKHGYLAVKDGDDGDWFRNVDWSKTKAFALGLGGIYLNRRGREAQGIVEPGEEAEALKQELVAQLSGLRDDRNGRTAIREVFATDALYTGPYLENAPDLIVGYAEGYRASWDGAVGKVTEVVFDDNTRAWSGDHCIDPRLVPGVLFSNLGGLGEQARIIDIAPTVLDLFGVAVPAYMEGKSLVGGAEEESA
jgi:predicted AlkP superfamily phosphohydrolase/phosphomutase